MTDKKVTATENEAAITVEELITLLQKLVDEGKGDYKVRSSEYEYHTITPDYFHADDDNKVLWYEA